jgi:hypothetical protein
MTTERKGDWMLTAGKRKYYPMDPRTDEAHIDDIARHLSLICRYNGALNDFYSVAQHSVLVSRILPDHLKLWGLLHDAAEAYCQDIIRPIKRGLVGYKEIEELNERCIAEKFDLPYPIPQEVKEADDKILVTEWRDLRGQPEPVLQIEPCDFIICPWSGKLAETIFLSAFEVFTGQTTPMPAMAELIGWTATSTVMERAS